jgi:hypothetical protein
MAGSYTPTIEGSNKTILSDYYTQAVDIIPDSMQSAIV